MNILHYTLGLPPERHGGSIQYVADLITQQVKTDQVFVLVCGDTLFPGNGTKIGYKKEINGYKIYKLKSPNVPTLLYGVRDALAILSESKIIFDSVEEFFSANRIDVFHIHTLMGLPMGILEFVKNRERVKIVYTTHDFFGLCLKVNFINSQNKLCDSPSAEKCAICNTKAPGMWFLRVCNSRLYSRLKHLLPIKKTALNYVQSLNEDCVVNYCRAEEYARLLKYYRKIFSLIDIFHFNSNQTKEQFSKNIELPRNFVIPVITSGIKDNRTRRSLKSQIRFTFIGSLRKYKGFPLLKEVLISLYKEGYTEWCLNTWADGYFGRDAECPNVIFKGRYRYSDIREVFDNTDLLIVPSLWKETFSLIVLEAMSYGVPVLVSNNVGAKDIVRQYNPDYVIDVETHLKDRLREIISDPDQLLSFNSRLMTGDWEYTMEKHVLEIKALYNTRI